MATRGGAPKPVSRPVFASPSADLWHRLVSAGILSYMRSPFTRRAGGARLATRGRVGLVAGLALALLGCLGCREQILAPSGAVLLETNASGYLAEWDPSGAPQERYAMEIIVAISNGTERPVSLQACADVPGGTPLFAVSMAATNNDWAAAYQDRYGCDQRSSITLAVGESRVDRIELTAPQLVDVETGASLGELEGRMRLVYYVDGLTIWSNAFEVRVDTLPR